MWCLSPEPRVEEPKGRHGKIYAGPILIYHI